MNQFTNGPTTYYVSHFSAAVHTSRPRWVFITAATCSASCEQGQFCSSGLDIIYTLNMTNGNENGRHYFSADKTWLPTIATFYALLYGIVLLPFSLLIRRQLELQKKYHHTVALLVSSVWLQCVAHSTLAIHYSVYGENGRGFFPLEVYGTLFGTMSDFLLLLMIILVGKGWTIVRRKISASGRVKIAIYMTTYVVCTWSAHLYHVFFVDPAAVVYIYSTTPGNMIVALRVLAFIWLSYSIYTTRRQYNSKKRFYLKFWLIGSYWVLSLPIAIGINSWIDLWYREKFFALVIATWQFSLHFVFLVMYNPGFFGRRLNRGFPFHATTNDMMKPRKSEDGVHAAGASIFTDAHIQKAFKLSQQLRHGVTALQSYTGDLNSFLEEAQTPSQRLLTVGLTQSPKHTSPDIEKQAPHIPTKLSPTKVSPNNHRLLQKQKSLGPIKPVSSTNLVNKSKRMSKSRSPRPKSTEEMIKRSRPRRNSSAVSASSNRSRPVDEEQRPMRRLQRPQSAGVVREKPLKRDPNVEEDDEL